MIAERQDLPFNLIKKLAFDPDWFVRSRIARRADLPQYITSAFENDEDFDVRAMARKYHGKEEQSSIITIS